MPTFSLGAENRIVFASVKVPEPADGGTITFTGTLGSQSLDISPSRPICDTAGLAIGDILSVTLFAFASEFDDLTIRVVPEPAAGPAEAAALLTLAALLRRRRRK